MSETTAQIVSSPPFVQVEGVINIRAVGGFDVGSGRRVKPSLIFRSGELSKITEKGKEQLHALKIKTVFDFRSDSEVAAYKSATPTINDIEFVSVPVSQGRYFDPVTLALRMKSFAENELDTFRDLYSDMLEMAGPAYERIFKHLIERPNEAFLVHCTAGKDRTGLFIALLLMTLGVDDQTIIDDYALTTIGLEPVLPLLAERFKKEAVYRDNWQGALNMGTSRPETMATVLGVIREKYGGPEQYLKVRTSLTDDDIQKVRERLITAEK